MDLVRNLFRPVPLGRVLGIPVLVAPALPVLLVLVLASASSSAGAGAVLVLLLVLVAALFLHELGHAFAARRLGLHVEAIVLQPWGGEAQVRGLGLRPSLELPVAAAGPLANVAVGLLFLPIPGAFAAAVSAINLLLGLANLLPALPLDGGRMLRAWLAETSPWPDATNAVRLLTRWVALGVLVAGAFGGAFLLGLVFAAILGWHSWTEGVRSFLLHGPPTLPPAEVWRRAFRRRRRRGDAFVGDPEVDELIVELESFHGTLEEFFELRRR